MKQVSDLIIETMTNETTNIIILKDYGGKFIYANKVLTDLLDTTLDNIIGKSDSDFNIKDDDIVPNVQNIQNIIDKGIVENHLVSVKNPSNNEILHYQTIMKPFIDKNSRDKYILIIANDITKIHNDRESIIEQEKILEQQNKLISLGEMIGNISHQWKQPLSVISTLASGTQIHNEMDMLKNEMLESNMENILKQTDYLSNTIDDFKNFLKYDREKKEYSITDTINSALDLVKVSLSSNYIKTEKSFNDDIKYYGFQSDLLQVLINILNNAKDVLKENIRNSDDRYIFIDVLKTNKIVKINIKDTAKGINKNIIDKVFDSYFTTKGDDGTGLGLYMSKKIIEEENMGKLIVENIVFKHNNEEYNGALFSIELPIYL